jgi:hypothetical protein
VNGLGDEASAAMREILLTIEYEGDTTRNTGAAASLSKSSAFPTTSLCHRPKA